MIVEGEYRDDYFPPAPVLEVSFSAPPHGQRSTVVTALVDTGADASVVPLSMLHSIGARVVTVRTVRSYIGERRSVRTYLLDVHVDGIVLPGIEVVGERVEEALLGRDVLNRLRLLLDGPEQRVEIQV